MDDKSFTIRVPKRWVRISMIVGATALIVAPLTAIATHTFNDVPNTHTFHEDIEWLEASGVTKGCNPPTNTLFCPNDFVTRGQMAAFMERFAGYLGAKDGTPAQADNAATADNAKTLDGLEADDFQKVPTTTQHLTIAGTAFTDANGATARTTVSLTSGSTVQWCTRTGGADERAHAAVHLPQGAVVTRMVVNYGDDPGSGSGNGTTWLTRMPLLANSGYGDIFAVTMPNSAAAIASATDTTPSSVTAATIDNTRYVYNVIALGFQPGNTAICGVDIYYEIAPGFDAAALATGSEGPSSQD